MRGLFEKSPSKIACVLVLPQKLFGKWLKLKIKFAFRALLGRAAREFLPAKQFALTHFVRVRRP